MRTRKEMTDEIVGLGYSQNQAEEIVFVARVVEAEYMARKHFVDLQSAIEANDWVHASALAREVAHWCDEQQRRSES